MQPTAGRITPGRNYGNSVRRLSAVRGGQKEAAAAGGTAELPFAMRMKDVCFRYGKEGVDVLDGVKLQIRTGEIGHFGRKRGREEHT
ncbi:MAG: hypothetical protein ACLRQ4_20195 [Neglectibacter timonensis]